MKEIYVKCENQKEREAVIQKMIDNGYIAYDGNGWNNGDGWKKDYIKNFISTYNGKIYHGDGCLVKYITAQEYLGEKKFKVGDRVRGKGMSGEWESVIKRITEDTIYLERQGNSGDWICQKTDGVWMSSCHEGEPLELINAQPFEDKSASEQGIDVSRYFTVINTTGNRFNLGEVVKKYADYPLNVNYALFKSNRFGGNRKDWDRVCWSNLRYATQSEIDKVLGEKEATNITNMPIEGMCGGGKLVGQASYYHQPEDQPVNQSFIKKTMSIINNAFKSKENKAMENFGLGTTDQLNERGRDEFVDYLFQNLPEQKKGFLEKIVEAGKAEK